MEVILSILVALFGIGFGIFMALQPEDAIALRSRGRYTQVPEPTEEYIRLTRLEGIVAFSALCCAFGGAAVRAHIRLSCFLLRILSRPVTMRKNAGGFLLWSSTLFSGS